MNVINEEGNEVTLPAPLKIMEDDQTDQMPGSKDGQFYTITRHSITNYSCQCMAWKMKKYPNTRRTCKHLILLLGEAHEFARTGDPATSKKPKAPKKRKADDVLEKMAPLPTIPKAKPAGGAKKGKIAVAAVGSSKPKPKVDVEEKEDASPKIKMELLLANKFDLEKKKSPTGYWISEKLDGIRAYWDGESKIYSRLGNAFHAPKWFTDQLPQDTTLDGELWHPDGFSSIVRSHSGERWDQLRYQVFDIPSSAHLEFEKRVEALHELFPSAVGILPPTSDTPAVSTSGNRTSIETGERIEFDEDSKQVVDIVEHVLCTGLDQLKEILGKIEAKGGEGLMLRKAKSLYVGKRSDTLLKVKTFFDAEAKVIGYEPGKGKHKGRVGSLKCQMASGKTFNCGTGLSDAQREDPPKIGKIISYRFQEITKDGVPRFPSFVGERVDMLVAKDADVSSKGGVAEEEEDELE